MIDPLMIIDQKFKVKTSHIIVCVCFDVFQFFVGFWFLFSLVLFLFFCKPCTSMLRQTWDWQRTEFNQGCVLSNEYNYR